MRLGALRPVGERLSPWPGPRRFTWPPGYQACFLDSGTSALGVAVKAALIKGDRQRVLLPAYTCPDVVSAVAWAGGIPEIVDTRAGTPWLDESEVARRLSDGVVAVVAPHFLGIPHPLGPLAELCTRTGVVLVEDSAQLGPTSPAFDPQAPLVVLSFGRGKPVPAGGGVLLYRSGQTDAVEQCLAELPTRRRSAIAWSTRIQAQNFAISRPGFALVRRLPGLHVGETIYKPLGAPAIIEGAWTRCVEASVATWQAARMDLVGYLCEELEALGFEPTAHELGWDGAAPLLRLPVLARDSLQRDRIVASLDRGGLGATAFYAGTLADLPDMPEVAQASALDKARDFAARLFTLPAHGGLRPGDIASIVTQIGLG